MALPLADTMTGSPEHTEGRGHGDRPHPPGDSTLDAATELGTDDARDEHLDAPGTPAATSVGQRLGDYRLEHRLGAGGMGEVFAARHVPTGDRVALKLLSSAGATRLYRFKREFRALADVSHENLIDLRELVVPERGSAYFTMELLTGSPFVDWVRRDTPVGQLPSLPRLEEGLRQLTRGVHHLHAAGYVHRDLKPSNVLVTDEGRVVVLDFGLVSELTEPDGRITQDQQILGTPHYMAPEQALGRSVGPPADFYAIGVMLFECLTGHLPHEGGPLAQLVAKHDTTIDPGADQRGIPSALRSLCVRLLCRDPDERAGVTELLERFDLPARAPTPSTAPTPSAPFVGREDELRTLHAALADVRAQGTTTVVHVVGRSGDGKSALVRRFREQLRPSDAVILHGRCREQEVVPYKGVDAVVDALSVRLRRVPKDERDALRPTDLYALVRLFPVLDEIWERPPPLVLASDEARRLGAVTLRKLLRQFGRRCPLVVHIDDFQWADRDSVELLDVLTRPPDDPAMLLVVSYRREEADAEAVRALLEHDVLAGERSRRIELGPLSAADARALAHTLLCAEAPETRRVHAESIALRSRGSPFYIAQMALEGAQPDTVESDLDAIVARRLTELPEPALRLLTVVAVFGGPLPVALARDLAAASDDVVGLLCAQGLLMRGETSVDESAHIETAHDRVREVVLTRAEPAERIRLHQSIGELLLAHHDGDPPADAIFMVVNHLDAGLRDFAVTPVTFEGDPPADWEVDVPGRGTDAVATSPERQLQLARLNQRAGQRALEAGAWVSARRYFDFAWDLCRSWRAQARRGQGHYALCVAVAFGRAQATFSFDIARADGWVRELLGWSLSMDDYCRVAQWYCASLSMEGRTLESVQFGVEALVHIGFPIPARPSWLRAIVSYVRGWRALWRLGIQRLRTSEPITDLRIRTAMDIAAVTGGWAFAHDLRLHCTLTGFHARLLSRHGFHDWAPAALLGWAASALFVGRLGKARDLLALIREFVETRPLSAAASCGTQAMMLSILPMFSPIDEVVAQCEPAYRRAREIAPPRLAELAGMLCANTHYLQSTPLRRFDAFLCEVERDWNGLEIPWTRDSLIGYRRYFRALEHGDLEPEIAEGLESLKDNANLTASLRVFQIEVQLLLGHITPAWEGVLEVSRRYRRALGPSWISPLFSLIGVLVAAERWQGDKPPRRVWRMCRRFRASAARWVKRCPQNFAPMVDIIDGELLGLEGRHEAAALALERARATAAEHGMHRVVGLASERLAKLTRRRGHALLAEGAFDAAHEAYEAWGATAVVLRLDRERVASPG